MEFQNEHPPKRRRIEGDEPVASNAPIKSIHDLREALTFRQNNSPEVREGIQQFKDFLTSISRTENVAEQATKLQLLKHYCEQQSSRASQSTAFPDLISTWSFAAEGKNEPVLSAVPAVLAQFFKTISSYLEFRDFGESLCKSLMQKDQVRLFDRGLSAARSKEHLISPCYRLLTEVVSFDGGVTAELHYAHRDVFFKRLDAHLEWAGPGTADVKDRRRPTARRIAQRYVIACLKFAAAGVKEDLIMQGKILTNVTKGLIDDGDDIVVDTLQAFERYLLDDNGVNPKLKSRFWTPSQLASLLALYGYASEETVGDEEGRPTQNVRERVHGFFLSAIKPGKGLLLPQTGWYPMGMNPDDDRLVTKDTDFLEVGLDSPLYFDKYQERVPIKNGPLSTFIPTLKPDSDGLQTELLLKIFEAAPELVADFFSKTTKFTSKPNDDAEWRAQSALVFSTIRLPVPQFCGWPDRLPKLPPPSSIVIESIIPRPLDRVTASKCLNLNNEILTLFAAKALTAALQKLHQTLEIFEKNNRNRKLWLQASKRLIKRVLERIPLGKDVILAINRARKTDAGLQTALLECLAMYYEHVPPVVLKEKFDVGPMIARVVAGLDSAETDEDMRSLSQDRLLHLLAISQRAWNIRWTYQPESLRHSALGGLLRMVSKAENGLSRNREVLVALQKSMENVPMSLTPLLTSLTATKKWSADDGTFSFLEKCLDKVIKQPIKYLDQIETIQALESDHTHLSSLACCVAEQWPFVAKNNSKEEQKIIATWIARLYNSLEVAGENHRVLAHLQQEMLKSNEGKARSVLEKAFEKQAAKPLKLVQLLLEESNPQAKSKAHPEEQPPPPPLSLPTIFPPAPPLPTSLESLTKWPMSNLDTDIRTGRLSRLLRCTCSLDPEIRIQAYHTIQSLLPVIQSSAYPEKQPLYLLLGELATTAHTHQHHLQPLPSVCASVANLCLSILATPTDATYGKINRFLLRSPSWDVNKLPTYWLDKLLHHEPDDDTQGRHIELNRLLDLLCNGLRTKEDMELYRRTNVFEPVLSMYSSPDVGDEVRRVVLCLVWRALGIDGAGVTLITRVGIGAWLDVIKGKSAALEDVVELLRAEVAKIEAQEEVVRWATEIPLFRKREGRGANGEKMCVESTAQMG